MDLILLKIQDQENYSCTFYYYKQIEQYRKNSHFSFKFKPVFLHNNLIIYFKLNYKADFCSLYCCSI
jgi:hypothetical protein